MNNERRNSDIEIASLRRDFDELSGSVKRLENRVEDLLTAWRTATGLVRFMKWMAIIVTSAAVIWGAAKEHLR